MTLFQVRVYHLVSGRSVCSQKVAKDFLDVHFACIAVAGRVVDSYIDGFSSNLTAVKRYSTG